MIYLTTNNICWHERMQKTIGPTTDQINQYCPDCGASQVTFPTADERSAAISRAINKAKATTPQPVAAEVTESVAKAIYQQWNDLLGFRPWEERGNSLMQDKARDLARAALSGTGSDESKKGEA